jgi:hypothetical protein
MEYLPLFTCFEVRVERSIENQFATQKRMNEEIEK